MSDTDTSDDAIVLFLAEKSLCTGDIAGCWVGWQECRRRCEARMEEEKRKYFEAGYQMRKTLPPLTPDEAYRAFKEGQK